MARECLDREDVTDRPAGPVRVKVARRDGEVLNARRNSRTARGCATEHNVPVKEVQALAMKAFLSMKPFFITTPIYYINARPTSATPTRRCWRMRSRGRGGCWATTCSS